MLKALRGDGVIGSGAVATEERDVGGFDRVRLSGEGELRITQGDTEALTIEAEDNILPLIESRVENGVLSISYRRAVRRVHPTRPIRYDLRVRALRGLHLSGSGNAACDDLRTDGLEVVISGSGGLRLGRLGVERLDATVSGSGGIRVADLRARSAAVVISGSGGVSARGEAGTQTVRISGSGSYDAHEVRSGTVEVTVSGSGGVSVHADEGLVIAITGSGGVTYGGDAPVVQRVSGSGRVSRR